MSEKVINVTDSSFELEVIQSEVPVLVDFWAPWCGPCRMLTPTIEAIAKDFANKLKVAKLNIDENEMVASRYGIRSIPTLMIFKAGKQVAVNIGSLSGGPLESFINSNI